MTDRYHLASNFLATTSWSAAVRAPLAGDASNRCYERLTDAVTGETAVLMDAPPEKGEDITAFTYIARYLCDQGLSAPRILAEDTQHGFLLIEDLGDDLFARIIQQNKSLEMPLYEAATDVLVALHDAPMPELDPFGPRLMAELVEIAFEKYGRNVNPNTITRFVDRFEDILRQTVVGDLVLVQRDYHAENLLWLPNRKGVARVGLLDFQAARAGHRAYDLVSLLQDARRDVPAGVEMQMIDRYVTMSGVDEPGFRAAYTVLGVQRNLRILGVFARLSLDFGKPQYVELIPRVWDHIIRGLEHPALAPIADIVRDNMPTPTSEFLSQLKS